MEGSYSWERNQEIILGHPSPPTALSVMKTSSFCLNTSMWNRDFFPSPGFCRHLHRLIQKNERRGGYKWRTGKFWLCQSTCSCSCQCSTTIVKRMKQATLFDFFVLNMLSLPCLPVWVIDLHLIIHFVYKNGSSKSECSNKECYGYPRGVANHPIPPSRMSPWSTHWISWSLSPWGLPLINCYCPSAQVCTMDLAGWNSGRGVKTEELKQRS